MCRSVLEKENSRQAMSRSSHSTCPAEVGRKAELQEHVRRLGEALSARTEDVLARTVARSADSDEDIEEQMQETMLRYPTHPPAGRAVDGGGASGGGSRH
jgi:hypothetical protein